MKLYRLLIATALFISIQITLFAQEYTYTPGEITDSIKVKNTIDQSYQLYLPTYFNTNRNWPVIFIFEPGARGSIGIKPFIKSSEAYGYILICSNNSKNNPYLVNYEIVNNLFADALARLAIDTSRIYLSGFSGGSRLACSIASNNKIIKGVIACGAGLPTKEYFNQDLKSKFLYAGIVGNRDMNYIRMLNNKVKFDEMGLSNILFIFNGDHKWPNDSIILRAFDWIELENLKQNNPHSKDLLFKYYAKDYTIANNKETSSNLISAYYEYINIIKNYSDIINVDSITLKILEIENNRSFNKKLKNKKKYELYEQELTQKYFDMIAVGMYSQSDTIYEYWKIKAKKLQRQIKSKNIEESKMAERIQSKIWMWCYESGLEFKKNNEIDFFIFANKLWTLIRPDHIYPNFQLAKYYASTGDNKETLYFLKRCVNNGLIDKKVLISTKEFENLKNNKDFQKLLNL